MPWFEHTVSLTATVRVWHEAKSREESVTAVEAMTSPAELNLGDDLVEVRSLQVDSTYEQVPGQDYKE